MAGPPQPNQPTSTAPQTGAFNLTDGWYIAGSVLATILLSGTQLAPVAAGIMTVALIYQLQNLLQGK